MRGRQSLQILQKRICQIGIPQMKEMDLSHFHMVAESGILPVLIGHMYWMCGANRYDGDTRQLNLPACPGRNNPLSFNPCLCQSFFPCSGNDKLCVTVRRGNLGQCLHCQVIPMSMGAQNIIPSHHIRRKGRRIQPLGNPGIIRHIV